MSDLKNAHMDAVDDKKSKDDDGNEILFNLSSTDCMIVLMYLVGSISYGLYRSKKQKTTADHFLAGRSVTWPFVGLSLFATNVSSAALVGLAGSAYKTGISVYNYVWMSNVILVIFSVFILPTILQSKIHTMPEFLEIRYSVTCRYYFSVLSIILNIIGDTGATLYGGSLVLKMIFPQLEIWQTVAVFGTIAGLYTMTGGLVAVIYTDAIQAMMLILGSVLVSTFAFMEVGDWNTFKHQVPAEHLSLIRPIDDSAVPWTGLLFGLPLLGFYYWCTNQSIVQRMLSAKDIDHGRWGALFGGIFNLPILFLMVMPGTVASVIYPNLPKPDMVYPKLMFTLLPTGVLGIVLAGFISAMLSDIESNLNSASTLITMDFVKKFRPDLTTSQLMKVGKLVMFFIMLASVCWAPMIGNFTSLYQYFQKLISYLLPPVIALYAVGFFWKGANAKGAFATLIIGNIFSVLIFFLNEILELIHIHFLHVAPILFVISSFLLIWVSLGNKEPFQIARFNLTWSYESFKEDLNNIKETPLWLNFFFHAFILLLLTAIVVVSFW